MPYSKLRIIMIHIVLGEISLLRKKTYVSLTVLSTKKLHSQGSHFFGLTKFHNISMIFQVFFSKLPGIFSLFLKYDFQVALNINRQTS